MCLPAGLLSFIAKSCTIYILGFSLYCAFKYIQVGFINYIAQSLPILLVLMVFLITGACSCIALNKKYLVAGLCTLFLSVLTFGLVFLINSLSFEYFDLSKGCNQLVKENQFFEVFIDHNLDNYFDETSNLLCSSQCPCKWQNKTETYKQNPSRFVVDKYNGAKNAVECPGYLDDIQFQHEKKNYLQSMIQLEAYGCSGYCKKKDFFSVSDINIGVPKHNCFDVSRHLQRLHFNSVLIGMYFLAWALVVLIPSTCCLFYQFSRESVEREKMIEKVQKLKSEFGGEGSKKLKKKSSKSDENNNKENADEQDDNDEDNDQDNNNEGEVKQEEEIQQNPTDEPVTEKSAAQKKDD